MDASTEERILHAIPPPENFHQWAAGKELHHGHEAQVERIKLLAMAEFNVASPDHCHDIGSTKWGTANSDTFDVDLLMYSQYFNEAQWTTFRPRRYLNEHFTCFEMTLDNREVDIVITKKLSVFESELKHQEDKKAQLEKRPDPDNVRLLARSLKKLRPPGVGMPRSYMLLRVALGTLNPPSKFHVESQRRNVVEDDKIVPASRSSTDIEEAFYLAVVNLSCISRLKPLLKRNVKETYRLNDIDFDYWYRIAQQMESLGYFREKSAATISGAPAIPQFQCSICEKSFHNEDGVVKHEAMCRRRGPGFDLSCPLCDRPFPAQHDVMRHIEDRGCKCAPPNNPRQFIHMCITKQGPQFVLSDILMEGKGMKNYRCLVCQRQFGKAADLMKHQHDTACCTGPGIDIFAPSFFSASNAK